MIRRNGELLRTDRVEAYNGKGTIVFNHLMEKDKGEFYDKGRLFSIITLPPGTSIGYHVHKGEMECYYVLAGTGKYNDNNENETTLNKGDTTITLDGFGHSIENDGNEDFVFIALVLFSK